MSESETYEAVWFEGRYRYELLPDSLRVVGSIFLQTDSDSTIPLAGLQVRVDRLRARSRLFSVGLWMATLGLIGHVVLVSGLQLDPFGLASGLVGAIWIPGLLLSLTTLRKTEFAVFVTDAGVPALTIPRSLRDTGEFEEFIGQVLARIRACKGLA